MKYIEIGVPQGSALGTLYNIFLQRTRGLMLTFADHTAYYSMKLTSWHLEKVDKKLLKEIIQACKPNYEDQLRFTLNLTKTKYMYVPFSCDQYSFRITVKLSIKSRKWDGYKTICLVIYQVNHNKPLMHLEHSHHTLAKVCSNVHKSDRQECATRVIVFLGSRLVFELSRHKTCKQGQSLLLVVRRSNSIV